MGGATGTGSCGVAIGTDTATACAAGLALDVSLGRCGVACCEPLQNANLLGCAALKLFDGDDAFTEDKTLAKGEEDCAFVAAAGLAGVFGEAAALGGAFDDGAMVCIEAALSPKSKAIARPRRYKNRKP